MPSFEVSVEADHLLRLALGRSPALALAELVWNSLDADATDITVSYELTPFGISEITVADDGTGISELDAQEGFRRLGGSWKRQNGLTRRDKRSVHGKEGRGRFNVFALGNAARWDSISDGFGGSQKCVVIKASVESPRHIDIVAEDAPTGAEPGTRVVVTEVHERTSELLGEEARGTLTEIFAAYLMRYKVRLTVGGVVIDPNAFVEDERVYLVPPFDADGRLVTDLVVRVLDWKVALTSKSLFLAAANGVVLHQVKSGILAPHLDFTAYAQSDYIRELSDSNDLYMEGANVGMQVLIDQCRTTLKNHYRTRLAERAATVVDEWKEEKIYPYEGDPKTAVESTERQVFDVVAVNVNAHLTSFAGSDPKAKHLALRLLRQAIETNPDSMQKILTDVLGLPRAKQDELAELLEETSLANIITASKLVHDRVHFLGALEAMLYEERAKKQLKERTQLHRMLVDHPWIFGENFHIAADDESLNTVLDRHLELMDRDRRAPGAPQIKRKRQKGVRRPDAGVGIVDLMLSKAVKYSGDKRREHLIVELKRPTQKITQDILSQITSYAVAVAKDARFKDTNTTWTFITVSDELDEVVRELARKPYQQPGLIHPINRDGMNISIWAKPWSEILEDNRVRHAFFSESLNVTASRDRSLEVLKKTHAKYFPPTLLHVAEDVAPAKNPQRSNRKANG